LMATATLAIAAWQAQPQPQAQTPPLPPAVPQAEPRPLTPRQQMVRQDKLRKELETPYRKWLNEDVAYIITDEERATFKGLQTDAEREQFIEQFWTRRDPTPGTVVNEMKEEHYRRIAYANEQYASGIPGWKTDRGRIYITYGPPDEIEDHGSTPTTVAYQQWRYKSIAGVGTNVIIEFVDPTGTHEYHMTMDPQEKDALRPLHLSATTAPVPNSHSWLVTLSMPLDTQGHNTQVSCNITVPATNRAVAHFEEEVEGTIGLYTKETPLVPGFYHFSCVTKDSVTGVRYGGQLEFGFH
jgi:GWxTD domain-containing protein